MDQRLAVPARLSSFIGRKKELGELRRQLSHTRLLTILGPGGAGKTRLATEFARQQEQRFADGQVVAELVEVRDPSMVADAIARATGVRLQADDAIGTLARSLRSRELLLVVDNCEHLVETAAAVVSTLLVACPRLVVLATSRERLNIEAETAWRLPPLAVPETADSLEVASTTEAVRLFVDRARSVRPGFDIGPDNVAAVVAICRRLDGMPLAIELAAARMATFSPGEIMARLDDRLRLLTGGSRDADQRHRTLRATVDWSYELLDAPERSLLQRLSVFGGPVRADAVEEICGFAPMDAAAVVDGLQRLVDKSMLQAEPGADGGTRFRLLETIRDYATGRLASTGEDAQLRDRHLAFYRRLAAEAFAARLRRGAMAEHLRLWDEMADVRVALAWANRDLDTEVELLGNLRQVWMNFAPAEGLGRIIGALTGVPHKPTPAYVRALWVSHALVGRKGDPQKALITPQELTELAQQAGESAAVVASGYLGVAYIAERVRRDLKTARTHLEMAVEDFTVVGDLPDLSMVLASLGGIEMQEGDLDAARPWIQRALEVAREAEDEYGEIGALYTLGWLEILAGDNAAATRSFLDALALVAAGDALSVAQQVEGIAAVSMAGDPGRAVTLFGAASRLREEVESPVSLPWSIWIEPLVAEARAALPDAAAADKAWESGRALSTAEVLALARQSAPAGGRAVARRGAGGLSKRELEVARLVASGMSNRAIAERLFLSERTVESHIDHILGKLGFNARTQVASWVAGREIAVDEPG